jgi:hypothetical protein
VLVNPILPLSVFVPFVWGREVIKFRGSLALLRLLLLLLRRAAGLLPAGTRHTWRSW